MASFIKSNVKLARDSLAKKDYVAAEKAATTILSYEPNHYHANVFLGLASLELGKLEESERVFKAAAKDSPDQILAWQGLAKFYEAAQRWDEYGKQLIDLCHRFVKLNDATKCAESLQKLLDLRRERGTRAELIEVLSFMLPTSPLYPTLSTLPEPDPTAPTSTTTYQIQVAVYNSLPFLEEIVDLTEKSEEETVKKEIEKRRLRLGAPPRDILTKEVTLEVMGASKLPALYHEVLIDPNTSDALRRSTEAKLFRHKHQRLQALPLKDVNKTVLFAEVMEMAKGVVLLGIPDELPWLFVIENTNTDTCAGYDLSTLRRFVSIFPSSSITSLLNGYFHYMGISLEEENSDSEEDEMETTKVNVAAEEDPLDLVLDGVSQNSDSLLAHRLVADVYLHEEDHQNCISIAEAGLELLRRTERDNGVSLAQTQKAFNVVLASGLVSLYPPKHHPRAIRVLDRVLNMDADNVICLMGRGRVLEYSRKWLEAFALFKRVRNLLPDDLDVGLRAQEEMAWCLCHFKSPVECETALREVISLLDPLDGKDEHKARAWYRLSQALLKQSEVGKKEDAYVALITSLKRSPTFPPSFTSLGIYYAEISEPPDPIRASKCFQKAFELDAREGDAARRLAEGFAEEREWDPVEIVARRTIEGEGGFEDSVTDAGREQAAIAKHLPTNSWAWKAVGAVELNARNYAPAITAFQVALRAEPEDFQLWLRLGEAYSKAGRHVAALKAFDHARELNSDDFMSLFLTGDVHRQLGDFQSALSIFQEVLVKEPGDTGILSSLAQTYLDLGRMELSTGYRSRCEESLVQAIRTSLVILQDSPGFRSVAWKCIFDALFELSQLSLFTHGEAVREQLVSLCEILLQQSPNAGVLLTGLVSASDITSSLSQLEDATAGVLDGVMTLKIAILACDYRLSLSRESDITGSIWYDLAISLHQLSLPLVENGDTSASELCVKSAGTCIKSALQADPGNSMYWSALGALNFQSQPKLAQHAYVKALENDSKSARIWANLGLLYLYHDDHDIANQAFLRAQTLDPDDATAWVGQSLLAARNGHEVDCQRLIEHAVGLSASMPAADLEYARRVFNQFTLPPSTEAKPSSNSQPASPELLLGPFFALSRYSQRRLLDASGLHLFALVCERLGHRALGVQLLTQVIALLETAYETSEDSQIERRFSIANVNLGRLQLGEQDYEGAVKALELALSLLPADTEQTDLTVKVLRGQAMFLSGLAQFKMNDLEAALGSFESALAETPMEAKDMRTHVTILLAQTLWTMGSDDAKETAKTQLLECIAENPEHLGAIVTLASIGTITADNSLVEAALADILALPMDYRQALDPSREVVDLLIFHNLRQDQTKTAITVAQQAVVAEPWAPSSRSRLASLILRQGSAERAHSLLSASSIGGEMSDKSALMRMRAISLALSSSKTDDLLVRKQMCEAQKMAEKAIVSAPWVRQNWVALACIRSLGATT